MTRPIIFGAGLAGLICARIFLDRKPMVMEKQYGTPNNHKALLRFRSDAVSRATNMPFKQVNVIKSVTGYKDPIKDAIAYSLKVTGKLHARSILDLDPVTRYIAPDDFISKLASTADITYGVDFLQWSHSLQREHGPIISTLPMPVMMDMFEWHEKPSFTSNPGWTMRAEIDPALESGLSCTVYNALKSVRYYRASITGSTIMIEGTGDGFNVVDDAEALELARIWSEEAFGLPYDAIVSASLHKARYQKISEMTGRDREIAKRFIVYLSEEHNIYSLGRFATWRPKLLLDDLVQDIDIIRRLIDGESLYHSKL